VDGWVSKRNGLPQWEKGREGKGGKGEGKKSVVKLGSRVRTRRDVVELDLRSSRRSHDGDGSDDSGEVHVCVCKVCLCVLLGRLIDSCR